jgi:regulator of cell morphogenesis and NO signaling
MRIEKDMKLADVIHHDFNLIPVINRFGIQLGFGDGTIEQICKEFSAVKNIESKLIQNKTAIDIIISIKVE